MSRYREDRELNRLALAMNLRRRGAPEDVADKLAGSEEARKLLRRPGLSLNDICDRLGWFE